MHRNSRICPASLGSVPPAPPAELVDLKRQHIGVGNAHGRYRCEGPDRRAQRRNQR